MSGWAWLFTLSPDKQTTKKPVLLVEELACMWCRLSASYFPLEPLYLLAFVVIVGRNTPKDTPIVTR